MKKLIKILAVPVSLVILIGVFFIFQSFAIKSDDGEKTVKVKIVKMVNGVQTVVDTTITYTNQSELDDILGNLNIQGCSPDINSILEEIDMDISIGEGDSSMVKMCIHTDGNSSDINIDSLLKTLDIEIGDGDEKGMKIITATIGDDGEVETKTVKKNIVIKVDGDDVEVSEDENVQIYMIDDSEEGKVHKIVRNGETIELEQDGEQKVIIKTICNTEGEETTVEVFEMEDGDNKIVIESKICILKLTDDDESKLKKSGATVTENQNELEVDQLNFYPNPSSGKFNLKFELEEKGDTYVKVFDINGKEIYTEKLKNFSGTYDKEIDISESGKGTYFLNIIQNENAFNKKILIQ